jgi:hypothetical protein
MTEQTQTYKKPTNAQEVALQLRARFPDVEITDYMIKEALGLDEDAPDPEGLKETLESINRQLMLRYPSNSADNYDPEYFDCDGASKLPLTVSKFDGNNHKVATGKIKQPTIQFTQTKPQSDNPTISLKRTNTPIAPTRKAQSENRTIPAEKKIQLHNPANASKIQQIVQWASEQQGETANITSDPTDFFWTPEMKNFKADILNKQGKIYIVEGFSGAGKSSFAYALQDDLSFDDITAVYVKLDGNLKICDLINGVANYLPRKTIEKMVKTILPKNKNELTGDSYSSPQTLQLYIQKMGPLRAEKSLAPFLCEIIKYIDFLLIDFPDYDKNSFRQMNKDIAQVQSLWCDLNKNNLCQTNIMLFIQREMGEINNHFFLKKATTFILRPLKPQEFTAFYIEKFGSYYPFTKDTLDTIAIQCGGTWRRFKKILEQCLNNYCRRGNLNIEITPNDVTEWIDPDLLADDRRLQFAEVFPKSERRQRQVVQVITYLESHQGEAMQSNLTQNIFDNDNKASSEVLTKLKTFGYITDEWRDRRKLIKLKSSNP